jgi:hypothetical protein
MLKNKQTEGLAQTGIKQRKPGSGGTRPGSGRPSLFKEKTKGIKFMCPISKEPDLKKYVNHKFLEWSKSGI